MRGSSDLKSCCAAGYESEFARILLGDSFHPGGLALTARLGELLELKAGQRILDVAAGKGESAIFLAKRFGCEVVGIDFGANNVAEATLRAESAGAASLVQFHQGDAEQLDLPAHIFDAVICECAFCTFPDKTAAAKEFARLVRPGGRVGLSDLTRTGSLPSQLEGLLAWIACIGDARPAADYADYLGQAGFRVALIEQHDQSLAQLISDIRMRLLSAELMVRLKKLEVPFSDFGQAKDLARAASDAVRAGTLGYSLLTATLSF